MTYDAWNLTWNRLQAAHDTHDSKTLQESQKAALRKSHQLSRCRIVLTKRCHFNYYFHYCHYYYYHNLSFVVLSQFSFLKFWYNLSFVTVWFFELCHNLSFWVCHNLSFWVLNVFEFECLSFVTFWVFSYCHNLSCWVLSRFEFLTIVTIWVFGFGHNLSFWLLSQFDFFLGLSQFAFFSF